MLAAEETAICEAPLSSRMINMIPHKSSLYFTAQLKDITIHGAQEAAACSAVGVGFGQFNYFSVEDTLSLSSKKSMSCGKWGVWGWKRLDKYNGLLLIKVSKTYRHFSNPIFTEFKTCWKLFLERSELNGFQTQWLEGWDALMVGQFIRKVNNVPRRRTSFLGFMLPLRFRSVFMRLSQRATRASGCAIRKWGEAAAVKTPRPKNCHQSVS